MCGNILASGWRVWEKLWEPHSGQPEVQLRFEPSTYQIQVCRVIATPKHWLVLFLVCNSHLAQGITSGLLGGMAATPCDPGEVRQPVIWGNVIGILAFHLLALYGLLTLPLTQIRWQTYLWGESLSCLLWLSAPVRLYVSTLHDASAYVWHAHTFRHNLQFTHQEWWFTPSVSQTRHLMTEKLLINT
jgi:hypothetical protein